MLVKVHLLEMKILSVMKIKIRRLDFLEKNDIPITYSKSLKLKKRDKKKFYLENFLNYVSIGNNTN